MTTIYFDSHLGDEERRRRLYAGDVFVYSPRPISRGFVEHARELIEEAFSPLDPLYAQDSLPVEKFVEIMGPLKPRFIHHPRTQQILRELLEAFGADLEKTYFDVPRMRVATSGGYLTAGVAYVLHPHRDIWYSSPPCQLNWWLPVFPFESESSFSFHPRYWNEPVPNSSNEYNHYEWNKVGRASSAQQVKADTRKQPKALVPLELEPELPGRLSARRADPLLGRPPAFDGAEHLRPVAVQHRFPHRTSGRVGVPGRSAEPRPRVHRHDSLRAAAGFGSGPGAGGDHPPLRSRSAGGPGRSGLQAAGRGGSRNGNVVTRRGAAAAGSPLAFPLAYLSASPPPPPGCLAAARAARPPGTPRR